jgi:hypothetical protein
MRGREAGVSGRLRLERWGVQRDVRERPSSRSAK